MEQKLSISREAREKGVYLGIDGARGGWIVACIQGPGKLRFELVRSLSALSSFSPVERALIDIPIGFPGSDYRTCDREARRLLRPFRHASIFFTPSKEALTAGSYVKACEINYRKMGKKLSRQVWAIGGKILETSEYLRLPGHLELRESHPELCFRAFGGVCRHSKKTPEGRRERLSILGGLHPAYPPAILDFLGNTGRKDVLADDLADAAILAVTAACPGPLCSIPEEPDYDEEGRRREIVFSIPGGRG